MDTLLYVYKAPELLASREIALDFDREQILANHQNTGATSADDNEKIITFVINHDPSMTKSKRNFFESGLLDLENIDTERMF
jgi:hypothetical protein